MFELLKTAGAPRVQLQIVLLHDANAMNGWPEAFWHIRQWQIEARTGRPASSITHGAALAAAGEARAPR